MKRTSLFLTLPALISLTAGAAFAEVKSKSLGEVTLRSGKTLTGVEVLSVDPDGLRVQHDHGGGKLKLEDLPVEIQERYKLDAEAAAVFRDEKRRERDDKEAAVRRAAVLQVMEATKEEQQQELERQRREVFAVVETGEYDFVAVDTGLRQNIAVWEEAGREDLAAVLEEDRQQIKGQQANRPGAEQQRTVTTLQARIQSLEQALQQQQQTPPPAPVMPEVITETVYVEEPAPVLNPIFINPPPVIVHPHPPEYCPPGEGNRPVCPYPPGTIRKPINPNHPGVNPFAGRTSGSAFPATATPFVPTPRVRPATGGAPRIGPRHPQVQQQIRQAPVQHPQQIRQAPALRHQAPVQTPRSGGGGGGGRASLANGGNGAHLWKGR